MFLWQDFVAGCFAGCSGVIAGYPLDTIKVRLQSKATASHYRGTFHCLSTIIKEEKVWGLYKGMSSPIVGVAAINSLLFGVYGFFMSLQQRGFGSKSDITSKVPPPTLMQVYIAGAGSGAVNAVFSCPIELVKIRLQNQLNAKEQWSRKPYSGPIDCAQTLWREQGSRGFFRGLTATFWRETPSYGAYFVAYEWFCEKLLPENSNPDVPSVQILVAGGLAGVVAWLVTYPFDVVKTRMQSMEQETLKLYKSTADCFVKVYRQEGYRAFFSGYSIKYRCS